MIDLVHQDLKRIRQHMGFSLKELSDLLRVNPNSYKKMELGQRPIGDEVTKGLSALMGYEKDRPRLEARLDYLRLRFKTLDYKTIIDKVLLLEDKPFVREDNGRYGYQHYIRFGDINLYYSDSDSHMGTLVEFSGSGCRQYEWYLQEEQDRDWKAFLEACFDYAVASTASKEASQDFLKVTRLDIALDELYSSKGNYDISRLKWKYDNGLLVSKALTVEYWDGSKGKDRSKGKSLYFGSKSSPILLNFYEKDLEQSDKLDVPVEFIHEHYGFKNRYEVRLLGKHSDQFVREWLASYEPFTLADKAVAIVNDKLHVYKQSKSGLVLDPDWYGLMGGLGAFKFEMHPKAYDIGVKEYRWFAHSVARTAKYLLEIEKIRGKARLSEMIQEAELSDAQKSNLDYLRSVTIDEEVFW